MPSLLQRQNRFLPTVNADGSRRALRPRLFQGRFLRARRVVGWLLIGVFWALPWLRVGGKPAVSFDIPAREFQLFGATFRATDGALLMLALLAVFVSIFLITAWVGRAWCGWACPQTVYMELLFRPLERWLEGGTVKQKRLDREGPNARRALKFVVFALLSVALANVFLAYFVGTERLGAWMTSSPLSHPTGFSVLALTSLLIFADFGFFREQMCTVACPYARLQSVLLDSKSLVVGYDQRRGEPRGRGEASGDCVDCGACVTTCPTGIDIRDGLQLECVGCAQCIDACDSVMRKFDRPLGLIRYASQRSLGEVKGSLSPHRPRLLVYPLLLAAILGALFFLGRRGSEPDITLLRGIGAPFEVVGAEVHNQIRIKIQNRTNAAASYRLELLDLPEAQLIAPENPLGAAAGQRVETSVFVVFPLTLVPNGTREVVFGVRDEGGVVWRAPYRLLGPRRAGS